MTCKDGADVGSTASVLMYLFFDVLNNKNHSEEEILKINAMLYVPALLIRERVIQRERFMRMLDAFKLIEYTKEELGAKNFKTLIKDTFGSYFKSLAL